MGGIIASKLGLTHISTGDIFREYISSGNKLGKELENYMINGLLVPDELTIQIIYDRLNKEDAKKGALLDGYPRTKEQAVKLDDFLTQRNKKIDTVVYLNVESKIILDRILKRRICSNQQCREIYNLEFKPPKVDGICDKCGSKLIQRKDDTEEVFNERLKIYEETSPAIREYYEKNGVLRKYSITEENHKTSNDVANEFVESLKK